MISISIPGPGVGAGRARKRRGRAAPAVGHAPAAATAADHAPAAATAVGQPPPPPPRDPRRGNGQGSPFVNIFVCFYTASKCSRGLTVLREKTLFLILSLSVLMIICSRSESHHGMTR